MGGSHQQAEARFDALWREHYRAVVAYGMRRSPEQARDIAAEVFLVAWRRLDQVPSDARPWLLAIARNKIANHRRGARRWASALARLVREPAAVAPDPADGDDLSRLRAALASLSARDREIIALTAWDGLSPHQVGTVLGIRPQTASVRLHRARRRLAAALDPPDAGPLPTPTTQESSR